MRAYLIDLARIWFRKYSKDCFMQNIIKNNNKSRHWFLGVCVWFFFMAPLKINQLTIKVIYEEKMSQAA